MSAFVILIYGVFFIILCLTLALDYFEYQRRLKQIRRNKQDALDTIEAYKKNNQTDVAHVHKEMYQRLKKRDLMKDLNDAYNQQKADDETS